MDLFPSFNETECGPFCSEPPPNILLLPPPPLPPFLRHLLLENQNLSIDLTGDCNLCHIFRDRREDSEFVLPRPAEKGASDSMVSVIGACILGLGFGAILLMLIWCKKWKVFPGKDSCPIFPDSWLSGSHKSAPPPSPTESCISPVVNEKSPQSIIMDSCQGNRTCIHPSKYWRRAGDADFSMAEASGGHPDSGMNEDHYADGSCTSSPVYAELDGAVPSTIGGSILMESSPQSISPYAVGLKHFPEALRMAALTSGPVADISYDNAAYLASATSDLYQSRSLRRGFHRNLAPGHLGSAAPLLTHQPLTSQSQVAAYLTGGRNSRRARATFAQHLARNSLQNRMMIAHEEPQVSVSPNDYPIDRRILMRHGTSRTQGIYSDLPLHSPSLSTFKSSSPYDYRENPKRPLPPVPGVRL